MTVAENVERRTEHLAEIRFEDFDLDQLEAFPNGDWRIVETDRRFGGSSASRTTYVKKEGDGYRIHGTAIHLDAPNPPLLNRDNISNFGKDFCYS